MGKTLPVVDLYRPLQLQHAVFLLGEEIKWRQPSWRGVSPISGKIFAAWMKTLVLDTMSGLWEQSHREKVEGWGVWVQQEGRSWEEGSLLGEKAG